MKQILVTSLFLITISLADQCNERMVFLEAKVDRILHILESTFRVGPAPSTSAYGNYNGGGGSGGGGASDSAAKSKLASLRGGGAPLNGGVGGKDNIYGGNANAYVNSAGKLSGAVQDHTVKGLAHVDTNNEYKQHGYNDELAYIGANAHGKDAAHLQAYGKDEAYLKDNQDGYIFDADYSGTRINDSIIAQRRNIVREEQQIEESFYNDYAKENHDGNYKGNEFDLGYKTKELNGGFKEVKGNSELEQNRYYDAKNENDIYKDGSDYNKNKYTRDSAEKDAYGRNVKFGSGGADGYGKGGYGDEYNGDDRALYDKYTGKKTPQNEYDAKFGFGSEREYTEKENDVDSKFHENEYGLTDKFGKAISQEDNVGVKQRLDQNLQYNNGQYNDVEANGFNKQANYKGDYATAKEMRNTGYSFKNVESVDELGTPDRFNIAIVNDNRVEYKGKERKSSINADRQAGRYTDKEINKKQDAKANVNAYRGNDHFNQNEKEIEKDIYYQAARGKHVDKQDYKKGYNDGYPKKEPKQYDYLPKQQYNDDDSVRNNRNRFNRPRY